MTDLRIAPLTLPGSTVGPENPLPFFCSLESSPKVHALADLSEKKRRHLGLKTGFRVLPYRMQDGYNRKRGQVTFRTAVLENEFLRAVFLPEMGGRLYSLVWKPEERELLHRNPVFQPANLANRNAWFSGGVEWNLGQYGHAFTTCSPVWTARISGAHGEPALRIYEYERCRQIFWQADFHLPPGLPFLLAYVRAVNPFDSETNLYWWTNIAVNEREDVRVLSPTSSAIYVGKENGKPGFGEGRMPVLPSLPDKDASYSLNWPFANEFFFQCDDTDQPWEAALDGEGKGLIETSTPPLRYRKLFVWGSHAGGRHWQEFLSQPGQAYIEIQGGIAPTQVHGQPFAPRSEWQWLQAFGYMQADPKLVHSPDWETAWKSVDILLRAQLDRARLDQLQAACQAAAVKEPEGILLEGSGWGALEGLRAGSLPAGFVFGKPGAEQRKWLHLMEHGSLPEQDPAGLPGEWMVQAEWEELLERSQTKNWLAWLHLGIMRRERGEIAAAEAAWKNSLDVAPTAWAWRNLAVLALERKDIPSALTAYAQAWDLASQHGCPPAGLAVEYLRLLHQNGKTSEGLRVYHSLPTDLQKADRIQMLYGQLAMDAGDLDTVEEILKGEYAEVREGENTLSDLWFALQTRREAARTGKPVDEALKAEVRRLYPPPAHIDFRMGVSD